MIGQFTTVQFKNGDELVWDNLNRLVRTDLNGQITEYGYDAFGRRLYKKSSHELILFGWDEDLMIWESVQYQDTEQNYTKHYVYGPNSFIPLFQTGYRSFIQLIE
ncbi:RHS repeat protein [Acinetobacter sp. PS-1]|nr:RHS repeat protein [Acinetobacter kanungonis]